MYTVQLPVFEGPLDLLLRLIEQRELDITAVSLALVTDQYLEHVRAMEQRDPAQISEFLVVAARLLLIKSRALLPRSQETTAATEEEDVGEQLARQLREYQQFKRVAEALRQIEAEGLHSYGRIAPPPLPAPAANGEKPRLEHTISDMVAAVTRRLQLALSLDEQPVAIPRPRELTVAEVAGRVLDLLRSQRYVVFEDLLGLAIRRSEVIVTLWAVLELWKQQKIDVEQEQLFGPIVIGRGPRYEEEQ